MKDLKVLISRQDFRSETSPHFSVGFCCGAIDRQAFVKAYGNHFRISSVCPVCGKRTLVLFTNSGDLIRVAQDDYSFYKRVMA